MEADCADGGGFGCEQDWAIGLSNKKALTAFQWRVSDECEALKIQLNNGGEFSGRLKYKGWEKSSWKDYGNVRFPQEITKLGESEYYYVFAIETSSDEIPFGRYIEATCQ